MGDLCLFVRCCCVLVVLCAPLTREMDSALPGLRMYGEFVEGEEADELMERCMEEIPWHVPKWSSGFDGFRGEGKDAVELPQLAYNYEERGRDAERVAPRPVRDPGDLCPLFWIDEASRVP